MKIQTITPPRQFTTGRRKDVQMRDCAHIRLGPDEQVTLLTGAGAEYDVARKSWGFYATPSINGRLAGFGLRAALLRSTIGRYFLVLIEDGHEAEYAAYLRSEHLTEVCRLDEDALDAIASGEAAHECE